MSKLEAVRFFYFTEAGGVFFSIVFKKRDTKYKLQYKKRKIVLKKKNGENAIPTKFSGVLNVTAVTVLRFTFVALPLRIQMRKQIFVKIPSRFCVIYSDY